MRLGLCAEPEHIDRVAEMGYDFLECNFANLQALPEEAFESLVSRVRNAPIAVEAANCLLPAELKLVGPRVEESVLAAYLEKGFARGERLGIGIVVFGSGGARSVPAGFDGGEAWRQVAAFLRLANAAAARHRIRVAIEPLRRRECNLLNYVSEATALAALLGLSHVGVLGDSFHMLVGREPYSALALAGKALLHVHASETLDDERGRAMPTAGCEGELRALFSTLTAMGYEGRVSVEAPVTDLAVEGPRALALLKACL